MAFRAGSANFSKGEIAEELIGRVDVAAYQTALRRARNVIVLKYGGVTKRPGTRLVAEVYADQGVRLMPFQFSLTQTYALEMGQGYMRAAANGGMVIEEKLTITGITRGATTTIAAPFHDYRVGDQVYFSGVEGTTELNGRIGRVIASDMTTSFVVDINSSGFTGFSGDADGITRTGTPPAPPTAPPVPPPPPPPPPPDTGGGGYYRPCVSDDTLILLADGTQIEARFLTVGSMLRTQHETSFAWGDYPVLAVSFAWQPVLKATIDRTDIRATADHRFHIGDAWVPMRDIGEPDGEAWVARISVQDARTYVSAGVLSHNIKMYDPGDPLP